MRRRAHTLSWTHFALAAGLILLGLLLARDLFVPRPVKITLKVGQRRTLPVAGKGLRAVAASPSVVRTEAGKRARLDVIGVKPGRTDLSVFEGTRLARRFQVLVEAAPPRRIRVVPRRMPPKPPPRLVSRRRRTPPKVDRPKPEVRLVPAPPVRPRLARRRPERPRPKPKPKPERKRLAKRKPPPERPRHLKMVELDRANRKKPREAKYLAQEDSAVKRETRARRTTLIKTQPGQRQPDRMLKKKRPGDERPRVAQDEEREAQEERERRIALAPVQPTVPREATPPPAERRPPLAERGRVLRKDSEDTGPRRPFRLFPSAAEIAQILRQFPAPGQKWRRATRRRATQMPGGRWSRIWSRVRGFIENFIPEVRPDTHTNLNARKNAFAAYIAKAHRRIHAQWGFGMWHHFRDLPDPGGYNPLRSTIRARLEIKIDRQGDVRKISLVRTSGHSAFDAGAMASVLRAAPFGAPPAEMVSKDGITYLHWDFYQDGRQCWTNDVQIFVKDT